MLRNYENRQKIFQLFLLSSKWYIYVIENTIGLYINNLMYKVGTILCIRD